MARQIIKRDPTDFDTLYSGAGKINDNFEEVYDAISTLEVVGELQPDNVDLTYHSLLYSSSYTECFFDIFREEGTVTLGGVSNPTYSLANQNYHGYTGSELYTQVVSAAPPSASSFYVHVEKDDTLDITTQYSTNGGSSWDNCDYNDFTYLDSYFTTLDIKIIWAGTGYVNSFGVLYDKDTDVFITRTKFQTTYVAPSAIPSGSVLILPENNYYTVDGKSLDLYRNGIKIVQFGDSPSFEEYSPNSIRLKIDLNTGDELIFSENYGYVDASDENRTLIYQEHNAQGKHTLPDISLGSSYGLRLVGLDLVVTDPITPAYVISYSVTRDEFDRISEILEVSSAGTKMSTFSYDIDDNVTEETTFVDGNLVKTVTYTYSGGDLTNWTVSYNT